MMLTLILIAILPIVAVAALFIALPYWHRDRLYFGVTVSPDLASRPEARRILLTYRGGIALASVISVIACSWALLHNSPAQFLFGILFQACAAAVLFAHGHSRVQPYAVPASTVRVASLTTGYERMPGGWLATFPPIALLCAVAIYLRLHWNQIPERFPVHWGLSGEPNGWAHRTARGVYGPLLIGVFICGFLIVMNWAVVHGTRRGGANPENAEWRTRFRQAMLRIPIAVSWIIGITFSAVALLPLVSRNAPIGLMTGLMVPGILITVGVLVWPLVRLNMEPGSGTDGTPDDCWKWGEFYYNPSDPALMVERRFGIGYTFNLANRVSWLLIAATVVLVAAVSLIASHS